jgi:hypothetical protein
MVKELGLLKIVVLNEFVAGALFPNCLLHEGISPLLSESASRPPCGFWRVDDQQLEN